MDISKAFGQSICKVRQSQGVSQLALSEKADLHLNTVQAIESGRHNLKLTTAFQLADALGVKMSSLVDEVDVKTRRTNQYHS